MKFPILLLTGVLVGQLAPGSAWADAPDEDFASPKFVRLVGEARAQCDSKFPSLRQARFNAGLGKVDPKLATTGLSNKDIDTFKACVLVYFPMKKVKTYPGAVAGAALVIASVVAGSAAIVVGVDIVKTTAESVILGMVSGGGVLIGTTTAVNLAMKTIEEKQLDENARLIFRRVANTSRIVHEHYQELDEESAAEGSVDGAAGTAR